METGDVEEFLRKKGALEILIEVANGSPTYQEISEAVLVSSSTVSTRLKEAVEKDFIELHQRPTQFGTEKRYVTTRLGRRIFHRMEEIDLDETVAELQELHRKRDDQRETLINRLYRDELILRAEGRIGSDNKEPYADVPEEEMPDIEVPSVEEMKQERLDHDLIGGDKLEEDSETND